MATMIKEKIASVTHSSHSSHSSHTDDDEMKYYRLRITAGPTYDKSLQRVVTINSKDAHPVSDQTAISVRIRDYTGLPSSAPETAPEYFDLPQHSKATFSIAFAFTPTRRIACDDLYFGIDMGHNPIRKFGIPKSLVNTAFKIVKEFIDPSLTCDAGADQPWLRGPVVAGATTTVCVGERTGDFTDEQPDDEPQRQDSIASQPPSSPHSTKSSPSPERSPTRDLTAERFPSPALLVEGATSESSHAARRAQNIPSDGGKRQKFFNKESNRRATVLEPGRTYYFDFSNGYIDWKAYALKLPGFSVPVLKYLGGGKPPVVDEGGADGEQKKSPSHKVRYFLKDVRTDEVFFVIMCSLLTGEDLARALDEDAKTAGPQRD